MSNLGGKVKGCLALGRVSVVVHNAQLDTACSLILSLVFVTF